MFKWDKKNTAKDIYDEVRALIAEGRRLELMARGGEKVWPSKVATHQRRRGRLQAVIGLTPEDAEVLNMNDIAKITDQANARIAEQIKSERPVKQKSREKSEYSEAKRAEIRGQLHALMTNNR